MTDTGKASAWTTVLLCFLVASLEGVDLQSAGLIAPKIAPLSAVRGTGIGAAVAAGRLGSVAEPLLAGTLVRHARSPREVLTALLPMVAISGTAGLWLAWRTPVQD